ncbi:MAG: hypothetical protein ACTHK0_03795 [Ginsengibacter sp.]
MVATKQNKIPFDRRRSENSAVCAGNFCQQRANFFIGRALICKYVAQSVIIFISIKPDFLIFRLGAVTAERLILIKAHLKKLKLAPTVEPDEEEQCENVVYDDIEEK